MGLLNNDLGESQEENINYENLLRGNKNTPNHYIENLKLTMREYEKGERSEFQEYENAVYEGNRKYSDLSQLTHVKRDSLQGYSAEFATPNQDLFGARKSNRAPLGPKYSESTNQSSGLLNGNGRLRSSFENIMRCHNTRAMSQIFEEGSSDNSVNESYIFKTNSIREHSDFDPDDDFKHTEVQIHKTKSTSKKLLHQNSNLEGQINPYNIKMDSYFGRKRTSNGSSQYLHGRQFGNE